MEHPQNPWVTRTTERMTHITTTLLLTCICPCAIYKQDHHVRGGGQEALFHYSTGIVPVLNNNNNNIRFNLYSARDDPAQ